MLQLSALGTPLHHEGARAAPPLRFIFRNRGFQIPRKALRIFARPGPVYLKNRMVVTARSTETSAAVGKEFGPILAHGLDVLPGASHVRAGCCHNPAAAANGKSLLDRNCFALASVTAIRAQLEDPRARQGALFWQLHASPHAPAKMVSSENGAAVGLPAGILPFDRISQRARAITPQCADDFAQLRVHVRNALRT
jgi:hypothetical protein